MSGNFDGLEERAMHDAVYTMIESCGEDPSRDGLQETPERVAKAFAEMTSGYDEDPRKIIGKVFLEDYDELVIVSNIPFVSMCEHHLLPFTGYACVGYLPDKGLVGLSKIPRLVQCFAKRLQMQERLTKQIATSLNEIVKPRGVGVLIRAQHTCMSLRGVKSNGEMTTSKLLGSFRKKEIRHEFLLLAANGLGG